MAQFVLYQKGPEDFYGTIASMNILYKKGGSTITATDATINNNFSSKFEYPLGDPIIISTCTVTRPTDPELYTLEITCNIPKCVDVSVKKIDYNYTLTDLDETTYWKLIYDDTGSIIQIQIRRLFTDAFESTNELFESMCAACLVFDFKQGTSFVNMSTNSYNETIGEVSDVYIDNTKINYTFLSKPSDVRSYVRIPMYYDGEPANVFGSNSQLTIESNNPSYLSSNFKGYYIGRSSSSTNNDDVKLGVSISKKYISIDDIVVFLNKTERQQLQNGENVDLCLWMHYTAPRLITPFNQRKIRIIKAY